PPPRLLWVVHRQVGAAVAVVVGGHRDRERPPRLLEALRVVVATPDRAGGGSGIVHGDVRPAVAVVVGGHGRVPSRVAEHQAPAAAAGEGGRPGPRPVAVTGQGE